MCADVMSVRDTSKLASPHCVCVGGGGVEVWRMGVRIRVYLYVGVYGCMACRRA